MAIDIYDKARIIKKDNSYYYFLKNGSKNCFTNPFQTIVDNNFNNKFLRGSSRESNWHLIATGNEKAVKSDKIADTELNCPTSNIYGQIRFGNKKNIALYFAKSKNKIWDYNLLSDIQQTNITSEIKYYLDEQKGKYTIDLANIPENKKMKEKINYCDNEVEIKNNFIEYNGKRYWDLDNL